jgi:hypothetical protein
MTSRTPEQIEADIVAQRAQLAGTVDQLSAKLDVKSRAQHKAADVTSRARLRAANVRSRAQYKAADVRSAAHLRAADVRSRAQHKAADVRARATTDSGSPRGGVLVVAAIMVWWRRRS